MRTFELRVYTLRTKEALDFHMAERILAGYPEVGGGAQVTLASAPRMSIRPGCELCANFLAASARHAFTAS